MRARNEAHRIDPPSREARGKSWCDVRLAGNQKRSRERHDVSGLARREAPRRDAVRTPAPHDVGLALDSGFAAPFELPLEIEVAALVENWRFASEEFATLLDRYGDDGLALRHFGLIAWEAGLLDRAADALSAGLALSPGDGLLWRDLAFVFQAKGRSVASLACIRRSLDVAPDEARSWLMLGNLLSQQGHPGEAEAAFRRSIEREAFLSEAHFGMALLCFAQQRFDEAVAYLRVTVALEPTQAVAAVCLGQALYATGDFAASATAFEAAAALAPLNTNAHRKFARARTFATMLAGRVEEALAAYPGLAGPDAEERSAILYAAFSLFSAGGHRTAAIEIGRLRLADDPGDPIQRYLLDALCGTPHDSAPVDYLERYFDQFAPGFDEKLVDILSYRVPQQLKNLVARHRDHFDDMLDLGCGTGLAVQHLAIFGGAVTGVDLSAGMLREAAKRGLYGALVKAEALDYLDRQPSRHDLVFAADVLTYAGDLGPLFAAVAKTLKPGGLFAANFETAEVQDFVLLSSGRFAHEPASVLRLAERHFIVLADEAEVMRQEGTQPVHGRLVVLQRR